MASGKVSESLRFRNGSVWEALLRISFGLAWVIDGALKFTNMQPSNVVDLVQGAGQGQPAWLSGWFNFWAGSVSANPAAFLNGVGTFELALGFALILGVLRKPAYVLGIILSLMIWSIDEGFGGPYGPGSTDIGAAVVYVFVFLALWIINAYIPSYYSLDAVLARKARWWHAVAGIGKRADR